MKLSLPKQRILDFDIECRPLSWYGGDYVTKEVTAIAWSWVGQQRVQSVILEPDGSVVELLSAFLGPYDEADIVTGHFIRGFDLPVINGALSEYQMRPLSDKLTMDTKLDLIKRSGMSNSQENIAGMLGLVHPKVHMDQSKWREANRLTEQGAKLTRKRVEGDVRQHKEMLSALLELDMLRPPVRWSGKASGRGKYHA